MPATRLRIAPLALTLVCVNACRAPDGGQRALPAQPVEPAAVQDPLSAILRYEAARSDGQGFLQFQVGRGDEPVRARAPTAPGRLPFPAPGADVSTALVRAPADISPRA